ncbi:MAG: hypothetical protein Q7R76_03550 [Candidatus Woesearchaeota archaeon]|nr:hypothetical protein [Candidatus Woesearchaeota archaeon]
METNRPTNRTTLSDLAFALEAKPTVLMRTIVSSDVQARPRRYNTFGFTGRVSRARYTAYESSLRAYFKEPFKDEGELVVPELLPRELFPFINAPMGDFAEAPKIAQPTEGSSLVYPLLGRSQPRSLRPALDLRNDEALYARVERHQGTLTTVELAKVRPHHANPDLMTISLSSFYALSN